jgi:hypothetical protein
LSSKTRKNKRKLTRETSQPAEEINLSDFKRSWISMRTGIRLITVISIALGIFTSINLRAGGWGQSLLWGLIIGGSIWLIFFLALTISRLFRKRF